MAAPKQEDHVRLLWNADNVKDVAESVGISVLGEDAQRCLAQDVEFRIGQVLVEALRFMRAAGRTTLTVQDTSLALRVLDVEPLYGYESTRPLRYGEASLGPGQPLFYVEDEEVEFEKVINAALPKVPRDASLTAHWLAIEGVQPSIPQNPTTAEARSQELVPKGPGANPALAALAGHEQVGFKPAVKHIISNELVLYFDKIQAALLDDNPDEEVLRLRDAALDSVRADPGLHQLVPYFVNFVANQVTHRLDDLFALRQALELTAALVANPHLFLDPYAAPLCAPVLTCLVARRLGEPATGGGVAGTDAVREAYLLREFAAALLGQLARKFAHSNALLRPKLTRTCLKVLLAPGATHATTTATTTTTTAAAHTNSHSPPSSASAASPADMRPAPVLYGAVAGLAAAGGPEAVRVLVLPSVKALDTYVLQPLQERGAAAAVDFAMLVEGGLVRAIRSLVPTSSDGSNGSGSGTATQNGVRNGDSARNGIRTVTPAEEAAELVDFLGPIVGSRIAQLGDRALNAAVLEARNIE